MRIAQHRHNQPARRTHGNAHMNIVLVDNIGAVNLGIDFGHFHQCVAAGFYEERHEAHLDAVLLFELVLVFVTQLHDAAHIRLIIGGKHGSGILRFLQATGDRLAQASHLDALFAGRIIGGHWSARGLLGCRGGHSRRSRWGRRGLLDVFFHDPPIAACSCYLIW